MPINSLSNQIVYREFAPTTESISNLTVSSKDFNYRINETVKYHISEQVWDDVARKWPEFEARIKKQAKQKEIDEEKARNRLNDRMRQLVKHVHWSGNTCIMYWSDGTTTKAHWNPWEEFDPEKAMLVCMARKLYQGTGVYNEVFEKYDEDGWRHYEKELLEDEQDY